MPTYQNTGAVKPNSLFLGSFKAEVSDDDGVGYTNVGLGRNFRLEEQFTKVAIQADNGPDAERRITRHQVAITFEMLEWYLPTLDMIRGTGIDLDTSVAGAPVAGATQVVASGDWSYDVAIPIENQMGAKTEPTVNSVTGSTDGLLVDETDYTVLQMSDGRWAVVIWDSVTLTTEAQSMTIDYDYTPYATRKLSTGGLTQINDRWWKFTNAKLVSGTSKERIVKVYSATIEQGLIMAAMADDADDPAAVLPMSIMGHIDTSRSAGDQLFIIEDSQDAS